MPPSNCHRRGGISSRRPRGAIPFYFCVYRCNISGDVLTAVFLVRSRSRWTKRLRVRRDLWSRKTATPPSPTALDSVRGVVNNNSNNNSHGNVYRAVIMTQSHCESSPGLFDECRLSAGWPPTGATENARDENAGLENDWQHFSKLWTKLRVFSLAMYCRPKIDCCGVCVVQTKKSWAARWLLRRAYSWVAGTWIRLPWWSCCGDCQTASHHSLCPTWNHYNCCTVCVCGTAVP